MLSPNTKHGLQVWDQNKRPQRWKILQANSAYPDNRAVISANPKP